MWNKPIFISNIAFCACTVTVYNHKNKRLQRWSTKKKPRPLRTVKQFNWPALFHNNKTSIQSASHTSCHAILSNLGVIINSRRSISP